MDKNYFDKLEDLMSDAAKVSILFADTSYFIQVLPNLPKDEVNKINAIFDHAYKFHKVDPTFMTKYRYLKSFMESNTFEPIHLNSFNKIAIISKN